MLRKLLDKLLALLERAMLHSAILEEADFRVRYFHHWVRCQASDIEHGTLEKCKDIIHYLDMRKK